ncbi:MAG: histidine kinase [Tannerella sp.]|nr:histidine kinase [Tannerella sp.]
MKRLIISVLTLLAGVCASSQERLVRSLTHEHYTVRDGLAQQQAFRIFEDKWGYLWITTHNGISVFDGKTFTTRLPKRDFPNDTDNITSYDFMQLGDDVLLLSASGITFFRPGGNHEFYPLPDSYRKATRHWKSIFMLRDDSLYLFNCRDSYTKNRYSFFVFDLNGRTFTKSKYEMPFISCIFEDDSGVYALNDDTDGWRMLQFGDEGYSVVRKGGRGEHAAPVNGKDGKDGEFAVMAGNSLYLMKDGKRRYVGEIKRFLDMYFTGGNRYIISTSDSKVFTWENSRLNEIPVAVQVVRDAMTDRNGNVWLTTENGIYNFYDMRFETYALNTKGNDDIWGVQADFYGNRWFSSQTLGFRRAGRDGRLQQAEYRLPDGSKPPPEYFMGYMGGCTDAGNRLWLNFTGGLLIFDPRKGNDAVLTHATPRDGSTLASYYDTLTRRVYAGSVTDDTLMLIAVSEDLTVKRYPFLVNHVISVCRDGNGRMRVGSFSGGFYFDEASGTFSPDTAGRAYRILMSLCADRNGTLWKGTDCGLMAEAKDGSDRQITANAVNTVVMYRDRYLIFGENRDRLGILDLEAYYRSGAVRIKNFDRHRGFDVLECGQNGLSIDSEGYVWIPGGDVTLRFHPDSLMAVPAPAAVTPVVASVACRSRDSSYAAVTVAQDGVISLPYTHNNLRFELWAASMAAPDSLRFRYCLAGYQTEWHQTDGSRTVEFQNLPGGTVRLEVQASIDGAEWSPGAVSPEITIRPPFWYSPAGLALEGGTALALAALLVLLVMRYMTIRERKEIEQAKLMTSSVKSRYIPHFTNNVLNSINYLIRHDRDRALEYIAEFSRFNRRTISGLDRFVHPLGDELEYAESYLKLEILRFGDKFDYAVDVAGEVDRNMSVPTMIVQTLCENAVKHGFFHKEGPGHLKIEIYRENNFAVLAVEDDGIGRRAAQELNTQGTGSGLTIVRRKIDFINKYDHHANVSLHVKDLYGENGNAAGTRFELRLSGKFGGGN